MSDSITTNLVGAHFRPPAKALLACLPAGHPLFLRPEPTNEYDENAVQVLLRASSLADLTDDQFVADEMDNQLRGQGFDLETVMAQDEWHLGFLPKAAVGNPALAAWNIEVQRSIHAIAGDAGTIAASLSFDGSGKPTVIIPWPPTADGVPSVGELADGSSSANGE